VDTDTGPGVDQGPSVPIAAEIEERAAS
jgi:hypothetical protein